MSGELVPFHKPWFCVLVMFIGMSGCIFLYLGSFAAGVLGVKRKRACCAKGEEEDSLLGEENNAYLQALMAGQKEGEDPPAGGAEDPQPACTLSTAKQILLIAIPTSFDLVATVLMSIGLLYVTVSIYQMMRGAELVFAAIFSVLFLGKKLYRLHYVGIALALIGITTVGFASVLAPEQNNTGTKSQQVFGICLIILSQAIQAG